MTKHPTAYQHKHAYVYGFVVQTRQGGREPIEYVLLTDIDGPNCKQNMLLLETSLRTGFGFWPKNIRFRYEKRI